FRPSRLATQAKPAPPAMAASPRPPPPSQSEGPDSFPPTPGPGAVVRQRRARGNRSSGRRGAALASLAPIRGLLSAAGERRGGAWPGRRGGSELSPDRSDFAGRFRLAKRRLDPERAASRRPPRLPLAVDVLRRSAGSTRR